MDMLSLRGAIATMDVTASLDELRSEFPALMAVGYADLSSRLILASSAARELPQEWWNSLCQTAAELLDSSTCSAAPADKVQHAISFDPFEQWVVVRSATSRTDALCGSAGPDLPVAAFIARATAILARIEDGVPQ